MVTLIGIIIIILMIFSGVAESITETLRWHYDKSVFKYFDNQYYWNPDISWQNKYESTITLKPKFFLSTSLLVWTTDAYHLFRTIDKVCQYFTFMILLILTMYPIHISTLHILVLFLASIVAKMSTFHITFTYTFIK